MPPWGIGAAHRRRRTSIRARPTSRSTTTSWTTAIRSSTRRRTSAQTWTRIDATLPKGHPLDYTLSIAENPHRKGMLFAGTGHGFFYSHRRRQDVDAVQGQAAGRAGELDRGPEERAGSRGRDLRPRRLDPARRLAAREDGRPGRRPTRSCTSRSRRSARAEGGDAKFVFALKSAPTVADHDGDPRLGRHRDQHDAGARPRRTQRGVVEPAATRRPIASCCARSRPTTRTSGRRGASQGTRASGRRTGASAR